METLIYIAIIVISAWAIFFTKKKKKDCSCIRENGFIQLCEFCRLKTINEWETERKLQLRKTKED
jgi:hypothetical protein